MMSTAEPLSAAVLAGGASRRMGTDKALLPIVSGGPPMVAIVLNRLRAVADDVIIVANDAAKYDRFGVPVCPDAFPGVGALGGIHSALSHARHDGCLVVACDMPFLSIELLQQMAAAARTYDALVPVLAGTSRQGAHGRVYQTLHAIYDKRCLPVIETWINSGQRQIIGFFDRVRVATLEEETIREIDPNLRSFFNANSPEALAEAVTIMNAGTPRPKTPFDVIRE